MLNNDATTVNRKAIREPARMYLNYQSLRKYVHTDRGAAREWCGGDTARYMHLLAQRLIIQRWVGVEFGAPVPGPGFDPDRWGRVVGSMAPILASLSVKSLPSQ